MKTLEMRGNSRKIMGCIFKTTHISAAVCQKLQNFVPYQSKKDGKDQESIKSSTTPVPGYQMGK